MRTLVFAVNKEEIAAEAKSTPGVKTESEVERVVEC